MFIAVIFGALAIGQASAFAPDYTKAKLSAKRIFALLDHVPLIDNLSAEGSIPVSQLTRGCGFMQPLPAASTAVIFHNIHNMNMNAV